MIMAVEQVKHPGTSVVMDGREYIVPALCVKDFRAHLKTLLTRPVLDASNPDPEVVGKAMGDTIPVLYLAFKRNYPDVTEEQFADMLDLRSYSEVTSAVMAESGVKPAAPGE
jgi:hypothetical protein